MAGPMSHCVYISDDGNNYKVRVPTHNATLGQAAGGALQSCTAATTEPALPKGYRPRKRYVQNTATGRENAVVVFDRTSALYTSPFGHGAIVETMGAATPLTNNATLRGRTGERDKDI